MCRSVVFCLFSFFAGASLMLRFNGGLCLVPCALYLVPCALCIVPCVSCIVRCALESRNSGGFGCRHTNPPPRSKKISKHIRDQVLYVTCKTKYMERRKKEEGRGKKEEVNHPYRLNVPRLWLSIMAILGVQRCSYPWSMVKSRRQATHEYAPPRVSRLRTCVI